MIIKRIALLTLTFISILATAQVQQGIVRTIERPNKPVEYLSGVAVRVIGDNNKAESNANGVFSLLMRGKTEGDKFVLQSVTKAGYELNDRGVVGRKYAYSKTNQLPILMVSTSRLQDDKIRIENNAYRVAENNYKKQVAKLEKQLNDKIITTEKYQKEIQELQNKFEKYQSLIDGLAEHYAHTDYFGLDDDERQINLWIEEGELEKADSLLQKMLDKNVLNGNVDELIAKFDSQIASAQAIIDEQNEKYAEVLQQQEKDAEHLYQLYTIALSRFDNEKAEFYITTRAALDTTNYKWQIDAGRFVDEYLGNYNKAMQFFECALRSAQKQNDQEWMATCYNDIGLTHKRLNNYEKALEYYVKAFKIWEQQYGENHPVLTKGYNNIATVCNALENYPDALEFHTQALVLRLNSYGFYHPDVATSYSNLGLVCLKLENDSLASEYINKALAIRLHLYGENHPDVANCYNDLGGVYHQQNNIPKALEYYEKALKILLQVYGENHPLVATVYDNIGNLYIKTDNDAALKNLNKALAIRKHILGEIHLDIALSYSSIGVVHFDNQEYEKASDCFEKSLSIAHQFLPEGHSYISNIQDILVLTQSIMQQQ